MQLFNELSTFRDYIKELLTLFDLKFIEPESDMEAIKSEVQTSIKSIDIKSKLKYKIDSYLELAYKYFLPRNMSEKMEFNALEFTRSYIKSKAAYLHVLQYLEKNNTIKKELIRPLFLSFDTHTLGEIINCETFG